MKRQYKPLFVVTFALTMIDATRLCAQTVEWIRQVGGTDSETAYSVSSDTLGNVFVSGVMRNNPGMGQFFQDAFFAKYDRDGNQIWLNQLSTPGQESAWGISADGFGNVYVEGDTSGNLFGSTLGPWDVWLAKYDGSGNLLWGRQIESAADEEYGTVVADPLGGVYISAATLGSLGGPNGGAHDQFLARYSADGDLLWTRQITSPGDDNYSRLFADNLGNVYIAARTEGSLAAPNAGGKDAYLAKYYRDGTLLWERQFGTNAHDIASGGVSVDALGNVFVVGSTEGSLGASNAGYSDAFLTKFSADGSQVWTRQLGSPSNDYADYLNGGGVTADGQGNVYITGTTEGDLGWGSVGAQRDFFVAKYDTNGNLIWGTQLGTSQGEGRAGISTDGRGNVYFSGGTGGSFGGPLAGASDAFVGKIRDTTLLAGDFNSDGTVDAADYIVWRSGMGATYNQADYDVWRADFGQTAASVAIAGPTSNANHAVPEPSALVLVAVGLTPLIASLCRRVKRFRLCCRLDG